MVNWEEKLCKLMPEIENYISQILASKKVHFGEANPPSTPGAYIIYDERDSLCYIGEAKGSGGLRDRLLSKHLSGDDKHAIQRAYKDSHPDRSLRRDYIKKHVRVQWVETKDANTALAVERLLILMFDPPWNQK
jgi:excinuclease UvrABC nuclease subunit